jgi:hypothetical protein
MTDTTHTTDQPAQSLSPDKEDRRQTMFASLTPALRRKVDQAIIDHDPPTYRGVHEKFKLAELGVGYSAFYRYARKLRAGADLLNLADMALPDEPQLARTLPRLLAQRLVEVLLHQEDASPGEIHRLTDAYRLAAGASLAREKFTAALAAAEKKAQAEEDEELDLLGDYLATRNRRPPTTDGNGTTNSQ